MEKRYQEQAVSMQIHGLETDKNIDLFSDISQEKLIQIGKGLFLYFLHDEYVCKFRELLTIEQYHSKSLAALYAKQYADFGTTYQAI